MKKKRHTVENNFYKRLPFQQGHFKMFFLLYWIFKLLCKYNVDSFQYMRVLKHKQQDYEQEEYYFTID